MACPSTILPHMSPELGLVCITVSKDVRYRTVTRKRLLEQSETGQRKVLDDIYRDNIQTLDGALQYCKREGIRLYRLPSSIFPFRTSSCTSRTDGKASTTASTPT
jgi:UV DNA damage endonuclease